MVYRVYLMRHGHVANGNEKRYLGRTDVPLDAAGIAQAKTLHKYFKTIPIDAVFTSPLKRCVQTTEIVCEGKCGHYERVEAFTEIDMGDWENVPMTQIKSAYPELYAKRGDNLEYFTPPHGESFHDVATRARYAFDAITHHATGTILIVAHAGVNRTILANILGISINEMFCIEQPYACVNELIWNAKKVQWDNKRVF
ncbi:histidine phosphatase family protein [Sulfurospirillum sp. UCH001]|uniref:histidine phosphatase family protein n=1 Tax=Sulfurospirillum sp. UCH001 TaxID=1581011 RepID=UPI000830002E|nr:histidine phosphatase family protein [Sulfurospirillum sp. UCH001]